MSPSSWPPNLSPLARRLGWIPQALRDTPTGTPDGLERTIVVPADETQNEKPKMYRVMLYNSERMDGAVISQMIQQIFRKRPAEAWDLMMACHRTGRAVLGIYTKEIAETKARQAREFASGAMLERHGFAGDLNLTIEAE